MSEKLARRNVAPKQYRGFRAFAVVLALLAVVTGALAQSSLGVKWMRWGSYSNLVYSGNGAYIFGETGSSINVYRASDGNLKLVIPVRCNAGVLPTNDGSEVYYQTGRYIWRYSLATRSSTLIWDEAAEIAAISLSADNKKMAFQGINSSGKPAIVIIDPILKKQIKRFSLPTGVSTSQTAFVAGDTRLLLGGLRLFSLDGTQIASKVSNESFSFILNPERTRAFSFEGNNTFCADVTSNLNVVWQKASTKMTRDLKCSSDGKFIVNQTYDSFGSYVLYFNALTGDQTVGGINLPGVTYVVYTAPDRNEFLVPVNGDPDQLYKIERYSFNTATGVTNRMQDLSEGYSLGVAPMGNASNPRFFTAVGLGFHYLRDSAGQYLGSHLGGSPGRPGNPEYVSPNGDFYVAIEPVAGVDHVAIHRYDNLAKVSSLPFPGATDNPLFLGWGNDSRLFAWNATTKRLRVYSFDGTTLLKVRDFLDMAQPAYGFGISPDGSKLVQIGVGENKKTVNVYKTSSGQLLGSFPAFSANSFAGLYYWTFVGNLWAEHEYVALPGSGYRNQMRLVDLSKSDFPTVGTPGYDQPDAPTDTGTARITPDGSMVIFHLIPPTKGASETNGYLPASTMTMIRVSDGAVVRSFSNLEVGTGSSTAAILADGATYVGNSFFALWAIAVPPIVSSFTINPTSVPGGQNATGTVNLNIPAGPGGQNVEITSTGLGVPSFVNIPEGQKTANFTITTPGVDALTVKTVTVTLDGLNLTAPLTVLPATHVMVHLDPSSVQAGTSSAGTVFLDALAGPSGMVVNLSSDKSFATLSGSVTVAAGFSTAGFTVQTTDPGVTAIANIKASITGHSASAPLEVKSEFIVNIDLLPGQIKGGNTAEMVMTITPAPTVDKTFNLVGNSLIDAPATITIPAGKTSVTIPVRTKPTATDSPGTLTVSNEFGFSKTLTITVLAPVLIAVTPNLTTVTGLSYLSVVVLLDGPAPAGFSFSSSSTAQGVATIGSSVTIPEGNHFVVVSVQVKKQTTKRTATIKIGSKSFVVTAIPPGQ